MIDTHTHSTISDGNLPPRKIILRMYQNICESGEKDAILAITDHDSTNAIDSTLRFAREMLDENYISVHYLPGAEAESRGFTHILMYFDQNGQAWKKRSIQEIFRKNTLARHKRNRETLDRLEDLGIFLGGRRKVFGTVSKTKTRSVIAEAIARNGYAATPEAASHKYLRHGRPAHVPLESPLEAYEIVGIISDAGALPVIAHPSGIGIDTLEELRSYGLGGAEVINGKTYFAEADDFARRNGLLRTVGSDCHFNGNKCFGYSCFPERKNTGAYHHISPEILEPIESGIRERVKDWLT